MNEQELYPGIQLHSRAWIGLDSLRPESRVQVEAGIKSLSRDDIRSEANRLHSTYQGDSLYMIQAVSNGDRFDILFTVSPEKKVMVLDLLNHGAVEQLSAAG